MILDKAKYHDDGVDMQGKGGSAHTHIQAFLIWAQNRNFLKSEEYKKELEKKDVDLAKLAEDGWFDHVDSDWFSFDENISKKLYEKYLKTYGKAISKPNFYVDYSNQLQEVANKTLNDLLLSVDKKPFWKIW